MQVWLAVLTMAAAVASLDSAAAQAALPILGAGNVGTNGGKVSNDTLAELDALKALGASSCRTNLYPGSYIKAPNHWDTPVPESMDEFMTAAMARGIRPVVLFEYYAPQFVAQTGFGTWSQWYGVGAAFATHLGPGGTWAKANNAPAGYGVMEYTAFNEPDGGAGFTAAGGTNPGPGGYAMALTALAAGVKSVDATFKFSAGGFMSVNAHSDCSLRGLGSVLAPLWNNGTLDMLDLHTYMDVQYAPMEDMYRFSAQANFDCVKKLNNVTNEKLLFTTTEFNYKLRAVDEATASRGLLTAVFDNLGVVNMGNSPVASRTFPWNLFNLETKDTDYGMATTLSPYQPTVRGCVLARAWALLNAQAWKWVSSDPRATGVLKLSVGAETLTVWQNRPAWTTLKGEAYSLDGLPAAATVVDVYGWDGMRSSLKVSGGSARVTGLVVNETHIMHAHAGKPGAGLSKLLAQCPAAAPGYPQGLEVVTVKYSTRTAPVQLEET